MTACAEEEASRRRDAKSLSQLKTDLLAEVAHELRHPLSAIGAAAGLLQTTTTESAPQRAIAVIGRQTNHLGLLIDDLLDLSRLSRQELQLHKSSIDLCEVVENSVNDVAADVAAPHIDLSSSLPSCPVSLKRSPR